ncbi:hypothetical protein DIPPA_12622 [Diplonema papillatum]|nr:hypothetical protein DIPPA_12622 [Diplonema papillatum]
MPFSFCERCGRTWVTKSSGDERCSSCDVVESWRRRYNEAMAPPVGYERPRFIRAPPSPASCLHGRGAGPRLAPAKVGGPQLREQAAASGQRRQSCP